MRAFVLVLAVLLASLAGADEVSPPYTKANPDEFLAKARTAGRPAVVFFNFDLESG